VAEYRDEPYGSVLYASFLAALQQYIGTTAPNFHLSLANSTTVQVVAGANSAQVGLGIDGLWRYITSTVNTAVSGAAGVYDLFAVTGPNNFQSNPSPPPPELDATNYAFALQALPQGTTPTLSGTVTNYRKVGELDWDGTKITGLRGFVGETNAKDPSSATAPIPTITPERVIGAPSQTAPLGTWESSGGSILARVTSTGGLTLSDALTAPSGAISGSLAVGSVTVTGALSTGTGLAVGGNETVTGTLGVTGATTVSALTASGQIAAQGAGTGLSVTNNASIGGNLIVTGTTSIGGLSVTGAMSATGDITARQGAATAVSIGAVGPSSASAIAFQGGEANSAIYRSGAGALTSAAAWTLSGAGTALTVTNSVSVGGGATVTGAVSGGSLTVSGTSTLTGLLTAQAGVTLDAGSGTATQTLTLTGRSAGTANSATFVVSAAGTVTRNVPTGQTHIWQVAATTAATLSPTALNLASGSQYQINGAQIAAANLSNGTTGTGAVVLAASPTITGTLNVAAVSASGAYTQSGSGANTFTGATTFSAAGTALTVTNNAVVGTIQVGPNAVQSNALLAAVAGGNGIEFGHSNTAGYRSTLGAEAGGGAPFLAFSAAAGATNNTYKTNGIKGSVFRGDAAGGFQWSTLATASADNQTPTNVMTLNASGNLNITGQYLVGGSQIAASNLSNGTTGTGAVVLANSPTFTGTVTFTTLTVSGLFTANGGITLGDAQSVTVGTTTGTKIATATTQKLGFWNATPVVQVAAPTQAFVNTATDVTSGTAPAALTAASTLGDVTAWVSRMANALQTIGILGSGGVWSA
jgi:hypothetical protein